MYPLPTLLGSSDLSLNPPMALSWSPQIIS